MSHRSNRTSTARPRVGWIAIVLAIATGCGTTRDKQATEQMLLSDAVDRAVARLDFSPLAGETVYLDTTYLNQVKGATGTTFVNADYIISSIRQQMVLAGCLLQETKDTAEFIAEARVGVLGNDAHDVNYGVPGSPNLSAAASAATFMGTSVPLPTLPEISFARKTDETAATKIAVFAYHRETREPVWQSGLSIARSRAQAKWILGVGPLQTGTIYEKARFAPLESVAKDKTPPDPEDEAYRNAAVLDRRLNQKLYSHDPAEAVELAGADTRGQTREDQAAGSTSPPDSNQVQRAEYSRSMPESSAQAPPSE